MHKLAVRRDRAGRGIGAAVVEWANAEAAEAGREFLRLDCLCDNPRIRDYYEDLGFEHRGDLVARRSQHEPVRAPGPMSETFSVTATDGAARAGVLRTAHGDVPTPAFMPVGTKATVKTVDPDELRALGTTILLGNTYHLHFRPGEDLIAELGGLHRFMGWDGPILTDSGGFQVFSLRDTIAAVDDDGVTFRSVYDGAPERFTPETVAAIQAKLGSDIAMCLDICPPADVPRAELAEAVRRTTLWAARQLRRPARRGPAPLRDRAGRVRPGAAPPLDRGDRGARLRRPRARRARDRRGARPDVRDDGVGARSCSPRTGRATSWASATRRACSR